MDLSRFAREFYVLQIDTDPDVTSWEASFDNGATWPEGTPVDGQDNTWRWLVHGPAFVAADDDTAPSNVVTHQPMLRALDNPEVVVRDGPTITLVD